MPWIKLPSVSLVSGQKTVTINSGITTNVKVGDAVLIGTFTIVEIAGVFANQLQLKENWPHDTQANVTASIVPTFGDFNQAVEQIRNIATTTQGNMAAMEKWWSEFGSVTFKDYAGNNHQVKTAKEMEKQFDALMPDIEATFMADCATFCRSQRTMAKHIHSFFMLSEQI